MKTRNILFAIALLGNVTCAVAQDVTILHMKDGTTRRYVNGVKGATTIRFYEFSDADAPAPSITTTHGNGYQAEWSVSEVWHIDGKYVVGVNWEDDVAANFQARHGLCFGTKPNLTIDNCDQKAYAADSGLPIHSMLIGEEAPTNDVLIYTPLEPGMTYYYRTFAEGKAEAGGQEKPVMFYGTERSFRVPRVMADFGYFPTPQGTEAAMAAFAAHFPADVTPPTWEQIEPLWNLWRASDEGQQTDISASVTTETFDDGTGYRINSIPDEFYTWIVSREIVIDAWDGIAELSQATDANGETIDTWSPELISNVDASWGVPGNRYVRFVPLRNSINHHVVYRSNEVVPGTPYEVTIVFAPETVDPEPLPTKVRVTANAIGSTKSETLMNSTDIPADVTTTMQVAEKYSVSSAGIDLKIDTRVSSSSASTQYNRIVRIAEIRLKPVLE